MCGPRDYRRGAFGQPIALGISALRQVSFRVREIRRKPPKTGAGVSPQATRHDAHAHRPKGDIEARKTKGRGDRAACQLERRFSESMKPSGNAQRELRGC